MIAQDQAVEIARSELRWSLILGGFFPVLFGGTGVLFGILSLSLSDIVMSLVTGLLSGYFIFGLYWGLKGVRTLIPRGVFLYLPIFRWMIYWVLKLFVAFAYGVLGGGIYEFIKRKKLVASHATA